MSKVSCIQRQLTVLTVVILLVGCLNTRNRNPMKVECCPITSQSDVEVEPEGLEKEAPEAPEEKHTDKHWYSLEPI